MADAPHAGDAAVPPDLPTTLEEQLGELHFAAKGVTGEAAFEELCRVHPGWADAMRTYRADMAAGEHILGRANSSISSAPAAQPPMPERIGPFRILELVGEGGFGVVYRAEQSQPVRRIVALKVLRAGRLDARTRLRFEAERQTLARMQHAGIAQVFDAGQTDEQQLYLAMEFVDGLPLTTWCDRNNLPITERLSLFLRVCAAVQHAHQRGVVHRDLKPGNVLVRVEDGSPVAKVIDFGVAKLLQEEERADGLATREGALIGTPGYMSPEQAVGNPVDTRTDVYALGVLLYELLTGDLPFSRERLSTRNVAEIVRIVCDEEPQRLSTAVRMAPDAVELIAARRGCRIEALVKTLQGDPEWIVRKALAKDPDRRYASVTALIRDVECYQNNEPVSAREPAAVYLLRKFVARHRLGVGLGVAAVAVTAVVIIGLLWALREVDEARRVAVSERGVANKQRRVADEQRDVSVLNEYHAHLAAAQGALQVGRAASARRHLLAAAPEHRGWEWRYLATQCDSSLIKIDGPGIVSETHWLDDDRLLVCYYRHGAEIRNLQTGDVEQRFPLEGDAPRTIYDAAHQRLITLTHWRSLQVYNAPEWDQPSTLSTLPQAVRSVVLSPDGRMLATSGGGGRVHLIDVDAKRDPRVLCETSTWASGLAFFADGKRLAVALSNGQVEIRDLATGSLIRTLITALGAPAVALAGDTLYAAGDRQLQAWDSRNGEVLARGSTRQDLKRLYLSVDGRSLYGCGGFGAAEMTAWDAATLEVAGRYHGHRSGVSCINVHPDGTRLATGSRDGTTRVWPAAATPRVQRLDAGFDARQLSLAPDGRAFACADSKGKVTVWNADSLEETSRFETGLPHGSCAMGGERVYAAGRKLLAIDCNNGDIREGDAPGSWVDRLAIDDHEHWLVGSSEKAGRLLIWQLPNLRLVHTLTYPTRAVLEFDPDRGLFAAGGSDGKLRFVDAERGTVLETLSVPKIVNGLAVDGPRVAIASDQQVHLIGVDAAPEPWPAHGEATFGVAFSPDGERLATGGHDSIVRLWNLDGTELLALEDSHLEVFDLKFAAGGRRLLGLSHRWSNPTEVLVWDAPPQVTLDR